MADFENYTPTDVGFPEFTLTEYLKKIEAYIRYIYNTQGSFTYGGKVFDSARDIEKIVAQLKDEATSKWAGTPTQSLPLFGTLMNEAMSPAWMAGRRGKMAEEQIGKMLDWQKQAFAEQKWATEQQWEQAEWQWRVQQEEYDRWVQQQKWQREMADYQGAISARDEAIRGAGAMNRLLGRQINELREGALSNEQKSEIFESTRAQLLSGLDPIKDAFQYWEIAHKPNKWAQRIQEGLDEMNPAGKIRKWQGRLDQLKEMKQLAREMEQEAKSDPTRSLSFEEQQYIDYAKTEYSHARDMLMQAEYESLEPRARAKPVGDKYHGYTLGRPEGRGYRAQLREAERGLELTPPAPEWLAKYWPEATKETQYWGMRAVKNPNLVPSGQVWAQMKPSERYGFLSHASWSGAYPEDVMWQMQAQLPKPRSGQSWQPFKQRV